MVLQRVSREKKETLGLGYTGRMLCTCGQKTSTHPVIFYMAGLTFGDGNSNKKDCITLPNEDGRMFAIQDLSQQKAGLVRH